MNHFKCAGRWVPFFRPLVAVTALVGIAACSARGQSAPGQKAAGEPVMDGLRSGFASPPSAAKPRTWWHWMNGNVTREGITADLEAMKRIGVGGATVVNVDCGIPRGPVDFMSPEWREDFKFAVSEANRLGLDLCVENCAGWSSSGGPWNTPANAMQRLTSSETRFEGPGTFDAVLKQPQTNLNLYREVAVLAFKAPAAAEVTETKPTTGPSKLEIIKAEYGGEVGASTDVTDQIRQMIQSGKKSVQADNGAMGGDPAQGVVKQLKLEFILDGKPGVITVDENETLIFPVNARQLEAAKLAARTPVNRTFVKPPPATSDTGATVPEESIVDLSDKLTADGRLKWDAPAGSWIILRIGYTPVGVHNHPSPPAGDGLECDKFTKAALDAHWNGFMQKVLDDVGPLAGKALNASLIDSYEVGDQDWSPTFREEFQKRRGYDPVKFLPTFAHFVVQNPAVTDRFLWDMRRTFADLFADNYYSHFTELCHQHGLLSHIEPYTGPFESMQSGASSDIVMGEFWTGTEGQPSIKLAASIAHVYGKRIVGAESFTTDGQTGRWQNDPYSLKTLGDLMYCQGLNRYEFHRYAMQPWMNRLPGMTMGEFGLNFERTQTWWTQGKAWIDYISRCQFLLQQGRSVADIAYFTGETAPVEMREGQPTQPRGYDYDAVNTDVLLHGAKVENGRITLASGANYAVLVLPPGDLNMTPATLDCIGSLVKDGATVVGMRPQHSPSLADFPACDARVSNLAEQLWGKCDGKEVKEKLVGKGRIVCGQSLEDVFTAQHLPPDFTFRSSEDHSRLEYVHRIADDTDIYFVSNQQRKNDSADCTFRVSGKQPQLWHPDTATIEPASIWSEQNGLTTVHLNFEPAGSVFVIFTPGPATVDHLVQASGTLTGEAAVRPKLQIQHAVYGAVDGDGAVDVTARLSKLIKDGRLEVMVNNDLSGADPALMHKKDLLVDYVYDGKPGHLVAHENQTLALPSKEVADQSPQWDTAVDTDGAPIARLWADGQVELKTAGGAVLHAQAQNVPTAQAIGGSWMISFPPHWGAPSSITMDHLGSWTDYTDNGVRYFSGTAVYQKDIQISPDRLSNGREVWLDLGEVKNFAEVSLNGQDFGVLWKPPFRANITSAAKPGVNKLLIKITNLWPNRLIGDEQLPPDCEWDGSQLKAWPQWLLDGKPSPTGRLTFTTWHLWNKDAPLLESGLLGPVMLRTCQRVPGR
jgi:hypothetical protein